MKKIKILYIEDDPNQRKSLKKLLQKHDFRTKAVSSGREGLELVRTGGYDVMLCDLNMPEMSGLQVLKKTRKLAPELPVIILTAHGTVEKAVLALKYDASDFVLKPPEINKIAGTIYNALEKIKLRKELQHSKESLQMIMENVPDVIYSLDLSGKFLSVSRAGKSVLGYTPKEMIGTSLFKYVYEKDLVKVKRGFREAMRHGKKAIRTVDLRMVSKSSEVKHFEVNRRLIFENGKVTRQDGILRDVTERKQLENELKKRSESLEKEVAQRTERLRYSNRQLAALNKLSGRLYRIHSEENLLQQIPKLLCRSLDFDRASLFLKEDDGLQLHSYCMEKDSPELIKNFLSRVRDKKNEMPPHFMESLKKNKIVFIPDLNADKRWPRDPGQVIRTKAVVIAPIKANKKPIGVIVGNMQHHDREMDQQDIDRFETFTNMVGLTLDNIHVYRSLASKVEERTKELKETNSKLRKKAKEAEKQSYSLARANVELLAVKEKIEQSNRHLKQTQAQLVQSEKMASLGMLVAGIAHEINTPIGAVHSMHDTLKRAFIKLKENLQNEFQANLDEKNVLTSPLKIIESANKVIDSGCERIINIVRRLRSFARLDEAELKTVDIHEGLEDTITLIHHQIKHNIKITKDYGKIPPISCFPGKLNQIFLNILINAKQAIKEKGEISITTALKNNQVVIKIKDNGIGIPKEKLDKIFDPGFTTKGVGVGTGLGLSIVYQIIEDHHGEITVESELGKGTTFIIILPMNLDKLLAEKVA